MAVDYAALKKGGFLKQKQKDHFSLRIQIVGGKVTSEQLHKIYEVADKYGKGYVHLTSRQSVEIPFIQLKDVEAVKEELAQGGCYPGVIGPRVRTITACQGNQVCPSGNIDTYAIAEELNKRYDQKDLPHKFKIGVTGCQNNCLKAEENDVGIKGALEVKWIEDKCVLCGACTKVCRAQALTMQDGKIVIDETKCTHCGRCEKVCPKDAIDGQIAYIVSVGGLFGNTIHKGQSLLPLIKSEEELFRVSDAAVQYFADNGLPHERFKFTIDRTGIDNLKEALNKALSINN